MRSGSQEHGNGSPAPSLAALPLPISLQGCYPFGQVWRLVEA